MKDRQITFRKNGSALLVAPPGGKAILLAIIFAGFMATLSLNLPGQLSYDSVIQLLDGRKGQYHAWHPPIMAFLLGLGDAVLRGAGLFVLFNTALCFFSFASLLWLKKKITWLTLLAGLGAVLTPQFLLYQGIVWKDVLFADVLVAGFVCLAHASAHWPKLPLRWALIAAASVFFVLAALARQNGVLVPLVGAFALVWIAAKQGPMRMSFATGFGTLIAMILLMGAASWALNLRSVKDGGPAAQITLLQAYDIVGALVHDNEYRLDILDAQTPVLAQRLRSDGVKLYSPLKNDTLEASAPLQEALFVPASAKALALQWRDLIVRHPWLYLRTRAEIFAQVFLTPDLRACVPYYVGVDGPAEEVQQLGLTRRFDASDKFLALYASRFVGTPILSHAAFALLALVLLVILLRRGRPADIALSAMLAAALIVALSFFVISIACDYRYLYALDLSVLYALLYLA